MVARALQKYGAINMDNGGAPVAIAFEQPRNDAFLTRRAGRRDGLVAHGGPRAPLSAGPRAEHRPGTHATRP